ncbi:MAG: tyrosine--tRNA ligase, partial [Gemmatimonadales bacterium]
LIVEHGRDPGRRAAQRRLADDITARVHGRDAVVRATRAAEILFGTGDVKSADDATITTVVGEVPTAEIDPGALSGMPVVDALVRAGLATSKAEARRGLAAGGFSINGDVAADGRVLRDDDLLAGGVVLLRKGKKHWAALRHSAST